MVAFRSLLTMDILTVGSLMAVDFQRDIRPVLASHCFKCHGPDDKARKAKLRLDVRPEADLFAEILDRIDHADPDELMPPPAGPVPTSVSFFLWLRLMPYSHGPISNLWFYNSVARWTTPILSNLSIVT